MRHSIIVERKTIEERVGKERVSANEKFNLCEREEDLLFGVFE